MELNFEQDANIDESALDVEWLEHSVLALKYSKHWAECKREVAILEERIKVVRSELINMATENPDTYLGQGVKPTAVPLEAFYRTHPRHIKIKDKLIEAQFALDMAEIAKNEICFTRKAALEHLVKLHGQNYFAGPSMPRDIKFERENRDVSRKRTNKVVRMRK